MGRVSNIYCFSANKNVVIMYLFLFMTFYCVAARYNGLLNDYPEATLHSEHTVTSGKRVKLKCHTTSCAESIIRWEYLPCGREFMPRCEERRKNDEKWNVLRNNIRTKNCTSTLIWTAKSSNESGLYRCLLVDEDNYSVLYVHQVNIDDTSSNKIKTRQELEIDPKNLTVYPDMKIMIQCKVQSDVPVEIRWLKQAQEGFLVNNVLYVRLNSTNHILFDKDTYISKLIIDKANEYDSGIYTCVAFSSRGHIRKNAFVAVIGPAKEWQESTSFSLLFCIPLGLALIPITVWLCYYKRKKTNLKNIENVDCVERENFKYYPVF